MALEWRLMTRRSHVRILPPLCDEQNGRHGRFGRPFAFQASARTASGAGAPYAGTADAGDVRRAARKIPMAAPSSHSANATDAMPPLQKPVRDRTATA